MGLNPHFSIYIEICESANKKILKFRGDNQSHKIEIIKYDYPFLVYTFIISFTSFSGSQNKNRRGYYLVS